MSKTNAFETAIQAHIFQNAAVANIGDAGGLQPSAAAGNLYVGLFQTTPTDSTGGTEATYTSYARQAVARDGSNWTELNGEISNTNDIEFPENTGASQDQNGMGILTAVTAGDLLYFATLTSAPRTVGAGVVPRILAGDLTIQED